MSFRGRILLVMVLASLAPLLLVGLWLTNSAVRSGDRFLGDRLAGTLESTVRLAGLRWSQLRSDLLFLAEDPAVQEALEAGLPLDGAEAVSRVEARVRALDASILGVAIRDTDGGSVWTLDRQDLGGALGSMTTDVAEFGSIRQTMPIYRALSTQQIGWLEVALAPDGLLPPSQLPAEAAGLVIAVLAEDGAAVTPTPFDAALLAQEAFEWGGEDWAVVRHAMQAPQMTIVIAGTVGPFVGSFEEQARRGTIVLLLVGLVALLATVGLTSRLTRSLAELADAAAAVADGDLNRTVPETSSDEVGRVAVAFNTMTRKLRRTLERLAGQESLASVGEFAAGLAHEVRNPLTAVQIDLQYVQSQLPKDSPLKEPQSKALAEIRRLDDTVRDALRVARSGRIQLRLIDLRDPIRAALDAAGPLLAAKEAVVETSLPPDPVTMDGDPGALEQVFLNLLMNASEAIEPGGTVSISAVSESSEVRVAVSDDGVGMSDDVRARAFEPLFSTRREGTGLGLPIARRIVLAHGGVVRIDATPGSGTTVQVVLPGPESSVAMPPLAGA